jgi:hypothetical protein
MGWSPETLLGSRCRSGTGGRPKAGAGAEARDDAAPPGPRAGGRASVDHPDDLELELADGDARLPAYAGLVAGIRQPAGIRKPAVGREPVFGPDACGRQPDACTHFEPTCACAAEEACGEDERSPA